MILNWTNWGAAMIDWTKPIETMDGRPARVLAIDVKGDLPVVVATKYVSRSYEDVDRYTLDGRNGDGGCQLFRNVKKKCKGWVAVVKAHTTSTNAHQSVSYFQTEEDAKVFVGDDPAYVIVELPEFEVPW